MSQILEPRFEAALMPHDGNVQALARISSSTLLPVDVAKTVLVTSQKYPYAMLKDQTGQPFEQTMVDGKFKRFYIFVNPEDPRDTASMLALQCNISKDAKTGIVLVMPEALLRGPEADAVLSVKFGCCAAGSRTMIYTDRKADGTAFLRVAFSGSDVRAEIQQIWRNLTLVNLNAQGLAALAHLADDMTGQCRGHAGRADYKQAAGWTGARLRIS